MTDQQQYEAETDAALAAGQRPTTAAVRKIEREQIRYRMLEHSPGVHCWDSEDSRFLICEANHRNPDISFFLRKIEREQIRYRMLEHSPGVHCWDSEDSRFLICEANHRNPDIGPNYLLSMFVTSEYGLQMQDLQPKSLRCESLLAMAVPYLYFIKKTDNDDEDTEYEKSLGRLLIRRLLREFVGLEDSDKSTREVALGKFPSVKLFRLMLSLRMEKF
uniref:IFT140 second beta-propeller domain-containing protein n=1 Tax=Ascaris lumbricoides TaxID=6252 RepID=A0A0M3IML5_ASCLU